MSVIMRKRVFFMLFTLFVLSEAISQSQTVSGIIPKGEKIAGFQFAYLNLNSSNSEFMLLANAIDASASFGTVSPVLAYAYAEDRVIGVSAGYTFARGQIDHTVLSLLNDGLDFTLEDLSASAKSKSVSVFHRSYIGLGEKRIFGLFTEFAALYSDTRTSFADVADTYSSTRKASLSFSPGVVFFPNQYFSTQLGLSLASVSYNSTSFVEGGVQSGSKNGFKAQASPDLLGIRLGIMLHF